MPTVPPCQSLGRHCRELDVVLRVADLRHDTPAEQDDLATWLLGHTQRVSFGEPYRTTTELQVRATIGVACRYLVEQHPEVRCKAHGFAGQLPPVPLAAGRPLRGPAPDQFQLVAGGRRQAVRLQPDPAPRRTLPVLHGANPCAGAPCRTADNTRGAACCRDLTIDVVFGGGPPHLLLLLKSRRSPYLSKVTLDGTGVAECELISACGYLEQDAVTCGLHGRALPGGRPAKPFVCREWPG
ncbi:MAG TPA: hypothetical protein VD793_01955, partial [Gemmatimonadales bacterium]|nr:hypothetical protein [Gemmatimonadales bacterium]